MPARCSSWTLRCQWPLLQSGAAQTRKATPPAGSRDSPIPGEDSGAASCRTGTSRAVRARLGMQGQQALWCWLASSANRRPAVLHVTETRQRWQEPHLRGVEPPSPTALTFKTASSSGAGVRSSAAGLFPASIDTNSSLKAELGRPTRPSSRRTSAACAATARWCDDAVIALSTRDQVNDTALLRYRWERQHHVKQALRVNPLTAPSHAGFTCPNPRPSLWPRGEQCKVRRNGALLVDRESWELLANVQPVEPRIDDR